MTTALVVVDIQNDYFAGGAMALEGSAAAATQAARLLARWRAAGRTVVHIQHFSTRPGAGFLAPDTKGVEIHASVAPLPGEAVMAKNFPNSFRATPLLDYLKDAGAQRLVVAGMMTHMCIDATVRAAFDLGFKCTLAHDACATRPLAFGAATVPAREVHLAFVAALHGLFADARSSDEILAAF